MEEARQINGGGKLTYGNYFMTRAMIYGSGSHDWEPHIDQLMNLFWEKNFQVSCGCYSPVDQLIWFWCESNPDKPVPVIFHRSANSNIEPQINTPPNLRSAIFMCHEYFYMHEGEEIVPDLRGDDEDDDFHYMMHSYLIAMHYAWHIMLLDDNNSSMIQNIWTCTVAENSELEEGAKKTIHRFKPTVKKLSSKSDYINIIDRVHNNYGREGEDYSVPELLKPKQGPRPPVK